MSKTKSSDRIRLTNGDVMTLGDALDRGYVLLRKQEDRGRGHRSSDIVVHYFAREAPGNGRSGDVSWEIGKTLYESRSGSGGGFREQNPISNRRMSPETKARLSHLRSLRRDSDRAVDNGVRDGARDRRQVKSSRRMSPETKARLSHLRSLRRDSDRADAAFDKARRKNPVAENKFYANPYGGANGFYFSTQEEYERKSKELYKKTGAEEWSIEFIDGPTLDAKLFTAVSDLIGQDMTTWFDEIQDKDETFKIALYWLLTSYGERDIEKAISDAENEVRVMEGDVEDWARDLIDSSGGPAELGEDVLGGHFDFASYGFALRANGEMPEEYEDLDDKEAAEAFVNDYYGGELKSLPKDVLEDHFDFRDFGEDAELSGDIHEEHIGGQDYVIEYTGLGKLACAATEKEERGTRTWITIETSVLPRLPRGSTWETFAAHRFPGSRSRAPPAPTASSATAATCLPLMLPATTRRPGGPLGASRPLGRPTRCPG